MAGAILSSLLKRLSTGTPKASTSSPAELPSSAGQELRLLKLTMGRIHAVLEDEEERDISDRSEQLRLQELKEVAYDAEDAVDEYDYEVLHAKVEARRWARATHTTRNKQVTFGLNSYHSEVPISEELAGRIKHIRQRFEDITNEWGRIILREKDGKRRCTKKWKSMETASCFDQSKTFGREEEKNEIVKWLLQEGEEEECHGHSVSVLCIVGMGGLGKTTLSQMAYNDSRVCQYFNLRGWVYVYEDFDVANLVKKICISFLTNMGHADELNNINVMSFDAHCTKLKAILEQKNFFLVLDDVWNEKYELWSSLKMHLLGVGMGKILVTTRNRSVAKIMQTASPINLSHLSFDHSWSLFEKIAYEGQDHNFLEIGKKIVVKCKGLPLTIKVLAGILSLEDKEEVWNDVLESELCEFDKENDDNILPILKLSYDRLPMELRQCFAYLCLFPKGSSIDKSSTVQQWISHGFIQSKGKKTQEDVGDDYFNEFLHRSILQIDSSDSFFDAETFKMHDLIHDLAQYVAKDEYLLTTTFKSHHVIPKTIRHVSVHISNKSEIINLEPLREAKHLRTLILDTHDGFPIMDLIPNLKCLRTLVLNTWYIEELPDSIGSMKHLRYLDIGRRKSIPASVYDLHHLRTLQLSSSRIKLSRYIGDLVNLRHLDAFDMSRYSLPRGVEGLTNLQTLPCMQLGVESGGNELWKLRDLKRLPNLRKVSRVNGLETVAWTDVTPPDAYLKDMRGIENLTLSWEAVANVDERLAAQVLDSLQPHRELRSMEIVNYPGVMLPTWLGHGLPALKALWIYGARRVKSLMVTVEKKSEQSSNGLSSPVESRRCFPSLEVLWLINMAGLEEWQTTEDLPCLHHLEISSCPKLKKLPSLSRLNRLMIKDCPELKSLPSLPLLTDLYVGYQFSSELLFDGSLELLQKLSVSSCPALRKLPSLPRLTTLWINNCRELKSLPSLPSLTDLHLSLQFNSELLFGCRCLPMLHSLDITSYSGETLIFPDDRSLDPLVELSISHCSALRTIEGLGGLASLHQLVIHKCPLLRMSSDERLPPNLQEVITKESPGAEEWYQNQVLSIITG